MPCLQTVAGLAGRRRQRTFENHQGTLATINGNGGAGNGFVQEAKSRPIEKIPVTMNDKLTEELKLSCVDSMRTDIKERQNVR